MQIDVFWGQSLCSKWCLMSIYYCNIFVYIKLNQNHIKALRLCIFNIFFLVDQLACFISLYWPNSTLHA